MKSITSTIKVGHRDYPRPATPRTPTFRHSLLPLLLLAPALAVLSFVFLYPMIRIVVDSLFEFRNGAASFVGLTHYRNIFFVDTKFQIAIRNNVILLLAVPVTVFLALITAFVLFENTGSSKLYRAVLFMPYVLAITVVSITFSFLYRSDGVLNGILRLVGLGFIQPNWLGNVRIAIFSVLIVIVWHETGFGIILFLARLMSVDPALFEAARVDGANWLQRLWHVSLPSLKTIIEFYTVIMVITVMAWSFNYIYSMTKGGPGNSTTILEFYIYNTAFRYNNMPYASALATLLFLLVLCLIVVQTAVRQRLEAKE